jgi:hypothetical protein
VKHAKIDRLRQNKAGACTTMIKAIGKRKNFQWAHLTGLNKIPCQG